MLSEDEASGLLAMVDDRNLAAHTYDEKLAAALAGRLHAHATLLRTWLERIRGAA